MDKQISITVPGIGHITASAANPLPDHLRALLRRDDRQTFWLSESGWPRDALGMVFLARAVHRIGTAMFQNEWTGFEPSVDLSLRPLPMFASQAKGDTHASERLFQLCPIKEGGRNPTAHLHTIKERNEWVRHPPQEIWDSVVEWRRATLAAIEGPCARLAAVKARLVDAMLDGSLPFVVRQDEDGSFSPPLPREWWNTEMTDARFYFCRLSRTKPITATVAGTGFRLLFVDGEALARLVDAIEAAAAPARTLAKRSAFRELLLGAVTASPQERMGIRAHWKKRARDEYRLPVETFREIWADVTKSVPGNVWNKPGRTPKKSPGQTTR